MRVKNGIVHFCGGPYTGAGVLGWMTAAMLAASELLNPNDADSLKN